ncbi:MAG: molybdopterin-dependent oxidoreductase [Chloroflexi bacterium]|nr:molybdopterin-dependent oxidoreductase [Chloroflexota bacterium]
MADVTLTIDGKEVTVPKNTKILEAAKAAGIEIPNLCYHPDLRPFGGCRLCLVQVEGRGDELLASCATPVRDGMVVYTNTPRVLASRRLMLELLLVDHPLECPTCDASGNCRLQKYTYDMQVTAQPFIRPKRSQPIDHLSPVMDIKRDRCVLCGQCVRVCDEIIGSSNLTFTERGLETYIDTAFGRYDTDTQCIRCGECIQVCPVGALLDRTYRDWGLPAALEDTTTTCTYCSVGCTLKLQTKNGRVMRVVTEHGQGINDGLLCERGRFHHYYASDPDRFRNPMIRQNGELVETSWDDALSHVAAKFAESKGERFAAIGSAIATNEDNYVLQKFARVVMGSNNIDNLEHGPYTGGANLFSTLGSEAMTNSFSDILNNSGCYFVFGASTFDMRPVPGFFLQRMVRQNNVKLVYAGSEPDRFSEIADVWLRYRTGTEIALLNGLAYIILEQGLGNQDYVRERTDGFDAWRQVLKAYTPERVSETTGVPVDDLYAAAGLYATGGSPIRREADGTPYSPSSIWFLRSAWPPEVSALLANLALLSGNIGRSGGGLNGLPASNNGQGVNDMGVLPGMLPGYQPVTDDDVRSKFEVAWSEGWPSGNGASEVHHLPSKPGMAIGEMLSAARYGQIKSLYIAGANPVLTYPDKELARAAMEGAGFVVVQDIWPTETTEFADVILPAVTFAEKNGTFTNAERRVQRVRTAVKPVGNARPDWMIIADLARVMGYQMGYQNSQQIMAEIAALAPIYAGISYPRLEKSGIQWPCPAQDHPGTEVLYGDGFPGGKARFVAVEQKLAASAG